MNLPGRVRVLRALLVAVWVGFLPTWLVAINAGVQPTVVLVATTFVIWMGVWGAGHVMLRRERCPNCGGALFAGELFESLRATACTSCQWEFGSVLVPRTTETDAGPRDPGESDGATR